MTAPLDGVRVLDLTHALAGPYCTMMLGDMGADVIKIEPPGRGEMQRVGLGFFLTGSDTAAFLAMNRNKRGCTLDLTSDEGLEVFLALVRDADVVADNYRPGVTTRLGIDYETLAEINPGIICASISGFGQTGPHAQRAGFDLIAQAMTGLMSVMGEPAGDPVTCGIPVTDLAASLFCAFGILNALRARDLTGRGQYVETSLYEAGLALSVWEAAELWSTGDTPQPMGSAHALAAPYQAFRTRDGHLTLGVVNQRQWDRVCAVLDRDDLRTDPRFVENRDRVVHRAELVTEMEHVLVTRPTEHWVERFTEAGVPAAPIRDYREALEDPHTLERDMVVEYEHPVEGTVKSLGIPVKLGVTPGSIRRHPPLLGEHTEEVLTEAGLDAASIERLRSRGVI